MSEQLTFGACAARLRAMGYAPCSALSPQSETPWRVAEDPCGLLLRPANVSAHLAALVLVTPDPKLDAVIAKHVGRGPVRIGSDGASWRLLRYEQQDPSISRSSVDSAVMLEHAERGQFGWASHFIRLDGRWSGGSPLDTPRATLPLIACEGATKLFEALNELIWAEKPMPVIRTYTREARQVQEELAAQHRPRMAAPTSKRDFAGQESLIAAWGDLYEKLPDNPPEAPAVDPLRAGVSQEELERKAALAFSLS